MHPSRQFPVGHWAFSLPVFPGGGPKFRVAQDPDFSGASSGLTLWRSNRLPRDTPVCRFSRVRRPPLLSGLTAEGETLELTHFDLRAGKVTRQI